MWYRISSIIIKYRIVLLIFTIALSVYMANLSRRLEISYDYIQIVPKDDPEFLLLKEFKETFGEDGNIFAIGMQDKSVFQLEKFKKLQDLCDSLKKLEGVKEVISIPTIRNIHKDTTEKKFTQVTVFSGYPSSQEKLDSMLNEVANIKMYNRLIFNQNTNATLIAVSLDQKYLNSALRKKLVEEVLRLSDNFSKETKIQLHYAGLPYIRSIMVNLMKTEFLMLVVLSVLVTSAILYLFFRSLFSVVFTLLVIVITVVCTGGTVVLLGYKITILTGILPALIIIISIPNCIYMYNKYHQEYKRHGNKIKAVSRIIEKIGFLTFMTNINTAVGFFVLYFTNITTIKEFGMSAGILSVVAFLITLVIIPTFLLFLPPPTAKQLKHLDLGLLRKINNILEAVTLKHRPWIYSVTFFLLIISAYGITRLQTVSYMVEELPENSSVRSDLAFFEQNFNGVMPLEIVVDLGKKKAVLKQSNLRKLEEFEQYLLSLNNVSPPLSILNIIKGARQAFYGGDPEYYQCLQTTTGLLF